MRWQLALISTAVLIFIINAAPFSVSSKGQHSRVIYGDDDRRDYYQIDDPNLLPVADATLAMFSNNRLETQGATTRLLTAPFGASKNLCASEPFYSQEMGAGCTGFLVAPDLVVTAGHCIPNDSACERNRWVFGFRIAQEGVNPRSVPTSEVYSCKEVVYSVKPPYGSGDPNAGEDFAIVRLDRAVSNHMPMNLRLQGEPRVGDGLIVLGHPASLPLKVAGGANIRAVNSQFFVANLDTYGGNSGSPVVNDQTLEVEGILVRGESDFVQQGNCFVSNRCPSDGCRGEDVTKIKQVLSHLPLIR
jgi:hypothetical protein